MLLNIQNSIVNRQKIEEYLVKARIPVTEQVNKITKNIDLVESGQEILKLFSQTDQEIFDGWQINQELKTDGMKNDFFILDKISRLSILLADQIKDHLKQNKTKKFKFILSGCGTSGRLAYLCSQTFNLYFKSKYNQIDYNICEYIIAGDDYALVNSVESVEDKANVGEQKLRAILEEQNQETTCIFIGITCGLSAPFVAGQINYCLDELDKKVVACGVIGFNPVEMTRKTQAINQNNESFYDIMLRMKLRESENPNKYFLLNPLIGPEPITGSTRMKSGTCIKIILDMIISNMFNLIENDSNKTLNLLEMVNWYQDIKQNTIYSIDTIQNLGELIDKSAESLRFSGGSINYLCDSERLGLLCCVDASECLPTYGADKNDIKGFISCENGIGISSYISVTEWNGFLKACTTVWSQNIMENLDLFKSDKCIFILIDDKEASLPNSMPNKNKIESVLREKTKCQIFHLNLTLNPKTKVDIKLKGLGEILENACKKVNPYFAQCLQEFALKICLNAISTGAHVLYGKTYENIMIDVKVSNIKLYWRAVNILKKFTNNLDLSLEECESYLLKSIYSEQVINNNNNIEEHIQVATDKEFVVPKALIMALTKCSYKQATNLLNQSKNSVRNCIFKLKNESIAPQD